MLQKSDRRVRRQTMTLKLVLRRQSSSRRSRTNEFALELAAFSLVQAFKAKMHAFHDGRSNSEDVAPYENPQTAGRGVLIAAVSASEAPLILDRRFPWRAG